MYLAWPAYLTFNTFKKNTKMPSKIRRHFLLYKVPPKSIAKVYKKAN
jgi:hypothetical protein